MVTGKQVAVAGRRTRSRRPLRAIALSFTVAAPSGARIRDRLCLDVADEKVLRLVGEHLGRRQRADLTARVRLGNVPVRENLRAQRKRALTAHSSSRWAGAITRATDDQYQLSLRGLTDEKRMLTRAISTIGQRLAVPCGERDSGVRGYHDQAERWQKQRRLQALTGRLTAVERRIESGRPAIVVGGRRLVKARHNLAGAGLTEPEWRDRWHASRLFLTADGESGAPHGNYTISVDPADGSVTIVLPEPLRYLASAPRGRYRLSCTAAFSHRREEWLDRVIAHQAVRYDITYDADRGRWYLDASWSIAKVTLPAPEDLARTGARLLGVDPNAGHLAACIVDAHGNPVGEPRTITADLTGPASQRDGRLRAAISEIIRLARTHGCTGIAIENLSFEDSRAAGRETMGRGRRGRRFRRTAAGMPTAQFRDRISGMAWHQGLIVVAVDPAYTSRWGGQHWQAPLQQQATTTVTRHHGAAVAIGRRALGYGIRRRPGVTSHHRRDGVRRAAGQAISPPGARGTACTPRTPGMPHEGSETGASRGGQHALLPAPEDRSRGTGPGPVSADPASTRQLS
jgi:hypothetical protein